jgi:stage V sporulation protein G
VEITAVNVRLVKSRDEKLKGFACVLFDGCFVVRDIKIIGRPNGVFVAMPSRKLCFPCPGCKAKNHLRARFCNSCGAPLPSQETAVNGRGRAKLYADIAHPVTSHCREMMQKRILAAYEEEVVRSRQPGYTPAPIPGDSDEATLMEDLGAAEDPEAEA